MLLHRRGFTNWEHNFGPRSIMKSKWEKLSCPQKDAMPDGILDGMGETSSVLVARVTMGGGEVVRSHRSL